MTVRKRVSSQAAAADLSVYAEGVRLMKERSKIDRMDPLGWYYQSRMHGNPQATERRADEPEDWSQCQHGSWFFLPWHRMYLRQFERIIQALTGEPEFGLPYWDYPSASSITIPKDFLDPASPLYDEDRNFGQSTVAAPTWQDQRRFDLVGGRASEVPIHLGEFPGFLEQNPHNPVHGAFGGNMGTFQSPLDPLFWIHHCNIDRLWEVWLRMPDRSNPDSRSWSDTTFDFPDPADGRRRIRVSDVATTKAAGYDYDELTAPAESFRGSLDMSRDRDQGDVLELLGAAKGGSVAERHEVRLERDAVADRFARAPEASPQPLFLRLENTGVGGGDATQMWNVFVRVGAEDWLLAGTIAPFGLAGLTERGGRQTLTFDISHLSSALLEADAPIEVKFEPARRGVTAEPFFERVAVYTLPE